MVCQVCYRQWRFLLLLLLLSLMLLFFFLVLEYVVALKIKGYALLTIMSVICT